MLKMFGFRRRISTEANVIRAESNGAGHHAAEKRGFEDEDTQYETIGAKKRKLNDYPRDVTAVNSETELSKSSHSLLDTQDSRSESTVRDEHEVLPPLNTMGSLYGASGDNSLFKFNLARSGKTGEGLGRPHSQAEEAPKHNMRRRRTSKPNAEKKSKKKDATTYLKSSTSKVQKPFPPKTVVKFTPDTTLRDSNDMNDDWQQETSPHIAGPSNPSPLRRLSMVESGTYEAQGSSSAESGGCDGAEGEAREFTRPIIATSRSTAHGKQRDQEQANFRTPSYPKDDSGFVTRRELAIWGGLIRNDIKSLKSDFQPQTSSPSKEKRSKDEDEDEDGSFGDCESDEAPVRKGKSTTTKRKTPLQHRPLKKTQLQSLMRQYGENLMNRSSSNPHFNQIASPAEVAAYDSNNGECCDPKDAHFFRVDIRGYPRSAWNKSCARVFARCFVAEYPEYKRQQDKIEAGWTTHFEHLRKTYNAQQLSHQQRLHAAMLKRRAERKSQLFLRRYIIAKRLEKSRKLPLTSIITTLGAQGMSSDESDHEAGKGEATYHILQKPWRSSRLTVLLRALDALHLYFRYQGETHATPGAWPHFRVSSSMKSGRSATNGLPKGCYSLPWLQKRTPFQLTALDVASDTFDLKLPSDIMKEAKRYDLSNRRVVCGLANAIELDKECHE